MVKLKDFFFSRLILIIIFFIGLSWINLVHTQPVLAAGKTAEEIFIQPITGLDIGFFGISPKNIIKSIISDNYQVYCANPTAEVSAQVLGAYERYMELGGTEVDMDTDLEVKLNKLGISDVVDISNPLTVDDSGNPLNIDQVTFQGNHEIPMTLLQADPFQDNVITADYYKRLSLSEQCNYQKKAQEQIDYLCDKKDIPKSECPLNIKIPNTQLKALDIKFPDCKTIEEPEVVQSLDEETLIAIANMPLPQINSKRIAFLMRCVEQRPSFGERLFSGSILKFIQGLFEIKDGDECHVLAIVVDSPTTEQEIENDPIEFHNLSRQILTPYQDWEDEKKIKKSEKSERLENALAANARGYSDSERINCINCNKGSDKEIKDALASYVNSISPDCGGVVYEESETISSQASITEGGGDYKASEANAFETFSGSGILGKLVSKFIAEIKMGVQSRGEIQSRKAKVETFIITPHDNQTTLNQFLTPQENLNYFQEMAESEWPTHVKFNETIEKEAQDKGSTNPDTKTFYDRDKCEYEYDEYTNQYVEIPGSCINSFGVQISGYNERPGNIYGIKYRGDNQTQASLFEFNDPLHNYTIETLYTKPDTEAFLKGNDGEGIEGEGGSCSELENIMINLPTMDELKQITCSIAGGNADDAQLLWGLLQIEGSPFLRKIVAGESQMRCGDLIINSCGASQIVGVLIPQCIDKEKCSQAAYIADDTTSPWIQEARNNPNIACDAKTSMEYILRLRKAEMSWLKEQYQTANGSAPSNQQVYYMMAGRNYGLPVETLVQPACQGAPAVQGCNGANYCECAMDTFSFSCN